MGVGIGRGADGGGAIGVELSWDPNDKIVCQASNAGSRGGPRN